MAERYKKGIFNFIKWYILRMDEILWQSPKDNYFIKTRDPGSEWETYHVLKGKWNKVNG